MVLNHSEPQPDLRACKYARSIKHSLAHCIFQPVKCALPQLSVYHTVFSRSTAPHLYDKASDSHPPRKSSRTSRSSSVSICALSQTYSCLSLLHTMRIRAPGGPYPAIMYFDDAASRCYNASSDA